MSVDMRHLGLDNKHKNMHKAGSTVWTYAEGQVSQNADGLVLTLSATDTLALCNLLYSHYEEIVKFARDEQRKQEYISDRRAWGNSKRPKL